MGLNGFYQAFFTPFFLGNIHSLAGAIRESNQHITRSKGYNPLHIWKVRDQSHDGSTSLQARYAPAFLRLPKKQRGIVACIHICELAADWMILAIEESGVAVGVREFV